MIVLRHTFPRWLGWLAGWLAGDNTFFVPDVLLRSFTGGSYDSFGDRVYMKAYRHKLGEQRAAHTRCSGPWDLGALTQIHPLTVACSRLFGLLRSCGPVPKKYIACTLTFPFLGMGEHRDKN